MKIKIVRLLAALFVIAALMVPGAAPSEASGATTTAFTATTTYKLSAYTTMANFWSASPYSVLAPGTVEISSLTGDGLHDLTDTYIIGMNELSFNVGASGVSTITAATITMNITKNGSGSNLKPAYYSLFAMNCYLMYKADSTVRTSDVPLLYSTGKLLGQVCTFDQLTTGDQAFSLTLSASDLTAGIDANGYIHLMLQPSLMSSLLGSNFYWSGYHNYMTYNTALLNLTYTPTVATVIPMSLHARQTLGTKTSTGTVTSISWYTPRLGFNNNNWQVVIVGTANLGITLVLENDGGTLTTISDQIGSSGSQWVTFVIPNAYVGYCRIRETITGKVSTWGYSANALAAAMPTNSITFNMTNYPQNTNAFSNYACFADGSTAFMYFKTNIGSGELSDHYLRLYYEGINYTTNASYTKYNKTFTEYATLTECDSSQNGYLYAGYVIFSINQPSGFNSRDNLIFNLNLTPSLTTWGFYQPVIYKISTSSELTNSLGALWYLKSSDIQGIAAKLDKSTYNSGDTLTGDLANTTSTTVLTNLNALTISLIAPDSSTFASTSSTVTSADMLYSHAAPSVNGYWLCRFALTKAGLSYTYTFDFPFTLGAASSSGSSSSSTDISVTLSERINTFLTEKGMNNTLGHWGFMLGIMLIVAIIFVILMFSSKSELGRKILAGVLAVVEIGIFGAFIATQFIDIWVVVLLALAAGGSVFAIVFKKAQG